MELIFGSKNKDKITEVNAIAEAVLSDVRFAPLPDFVPDVDETGTSYEENATLKAVQQARILGRPVLAEDSGLAVAALNDLPGVWSARFSNASFDYSQGTLVSELPETQKLRGQELRDANNVLLQSLLRMSDDREASLKVCFVLAMPTGEVAYREVSSYPARITEQPRGKNGFAYDPFIEGKNTDGRTMGELEFAEKVALGPRREPLEQFAAFCSAQVEELSALLAFPDDLAPWQSLSDDYFKSQTHSVQGNLLEQISREEIAAQLETVLRSDKPIKVHPLGFVQIPLSGGSHRHNEGYRLNIWPEGYRLGDGNDIHAHTFSMVSTVLVGAITNYEFDWLPDAAGPTVIGKISHEGSKHFLRDTGKRGYFKQTTAETMQPGDEYYVMRGRYHTTSLPGDFTVTLINRYEIDADAPNLVIATKGLDEPVVYDERPLSQEQARAEVARAIVELQK